MKTLNFEDLKIKSPKAPAKGYSKDYFEDVHSVIQRINKYITKKGQIAPRQKGEYEILMYAMKNEVEAFSLIYALDLAYENVEKAFQIIKK